MEITTEQRARSTRNITLWGVLVNVLLAIVKTIGGLFGQSAALLADGLHSISDLASDAMVLFAARQVSQGADDDHPYGHERFETLATVILSALLILVGALIAWDGIHRLIEGNRLEVPHVFTLYIAGLSVVSKEVLYHLTRRVGRRIRSKMLEANAWHHRTDAVSSVVVIIGIGGALSGYPMLDAYAAIVVAVMIIKIGIDLGQQSIMELVDTALDPEQTEEIRQAILSIPDVRQMHMLRSRRMGQNALIDVHIQVSPRLSVSEGHHISEVVERTLKQLFEAVNDVTVHIDPEDDEDGASCDELPLRSEILVELRHAWSSVPEFAELEDITLHYLKGEIAVEATLPAAGLENLARITPLQRRFDESCRAIDSVGKGRLRFR